MYPNIPYLKVLYVGIVNLLQSSSRLHFTYRPKGGSNEKESVVLTSSTFKRNMCEPTAAISEIIVRRPLTANCLEFVIVIFVHLSAKRRKTTKKRKLVSNVERDFLWHPKTVRLFSARLPATVYCLFSFRFFVLLFESSEVLYKVL